MCRFPILFLAVWLLSACSTLIAPLERYGTADDPEPRYTELAKVLLKHVGRDGLVDYAGLAEDPSALERQYSWFAKVGPSLSAGRFPREADRLAYWINAYNTAVLVSVTRSYPIESVKDVAPPWYLFVLPDLAGFFYLRTHPIDGEELDLQALENDVVRSRFEDPRIHFALNCASLGCPQLPRQPFLPDSLDDQLERETRRFFADPENLVVDHERQVVRVSPILDWYREDFANAAGDSSDRVLLEFVVRHCDFRIAQRLEDALSRDYVLEFLEYDWRLNGRDVVEASESTAD